MGTVRNVFLRYYDIYLQGIEAALYASAISLVLALIVGMIGGIARYNDKGITGKIAAGYVTIIRNTPLLIQLYFIFFGLPRLGITLSAFQTGIIGLTLNSGAYITEMVKGGLQAIPKGQKEAGIALALTGWQRLKLILIPQAAPQMIPAIGGQFVQLIKDTCLLSMLAVLEITKAAELVGAESFLFLEAFIISGVIYLLICILLNVAVDLVERKFKFAH